MSFEATLAEAMTSKEAGNVHFKNCQYLEAVKCYSHALAKCPQGEESRAVFLKNRAACYLKLERYSCASDDCTQALQVSPNDIKALYRRALAYEASGNLTAAFKDVKYLLSIEPQNKEAVELARKLTTIMKKHHEILQSSEGMINEMVQALKDPTLSPSKLVMAAKNCAILSQEQPVAEKLYEAGVVDLLLPLLDSKCVEVIHHVLQTFVGLCMGQKARAYAVIQKISIEKISTLICHDSLEVSCSVVAVIKQVLLSISDEDTVSPKSSDSAVVVAADTGIINPIMQMVFPLLLGKVVTTTARDRIMEMLMSTIAKGHFVSSLYLKGSLVSKLLQLSATSEGDDLSEECRANISVVLSTLHKNCFPEEKSAMEKECTSFVHDRLATGEFSSKREAVIAVATLLHGVLDIGANIFIDKLVFDEVLKMATCDSIEGQSVAAEALALAASNKERCHGILEDGLPVLKNLFSSSDDGVKVRALVGLCKLGGVGGSNINARTFAEGSGLKLERACCKFLLDSKKCSRLYKWAMEGLAFLSLDAQVKEAIVTNQKAISAVCDIPTTGEQAVLYGVATILVNLTNSYDKPERNPELEELGQYAGENVPKEHELDGEQYVKKRISSLLNQGVVAALLVLSAVESDGIREQVARVYLALVEEVSHRGTVLQQGGVKALLLLTNHNTIKGKLLAAQALAKLGITNDPRLSFPGQKSLEVVRPLVQLLKSEQGLQQFEALMALTNLAGTTDDVRQRIIKEEGISLMESLMFEEHDLIRRAATEALCNMIQVPQVHERFLSDETERVKLWTLFAGEDDLKLALAASGGLAQLTHDPRICTKVMQVKSATNIFKELLATDEEELQHRAAYIIANLVGASKEIAQELISSDFLEILMALSQSTTSLQSVQDSAKRALQKAMEYGLIQPNPELNIKH